MCKRLLMYTAVFMALLFCVQGTSAKGGSITLANQTGRTICTLYVSPITYDWWYPDVLNGKTLADKASYTFSLEWSTDGMYDVMAQDCRSDAITTVYSVNLSAGNAYILRYNQIIPDNSSPQYPPPNEGGSVPCPATGSWPSGCVPGGGGGTSPPPVNSGGGVPCPATGSWPPGCVPGGGGGGASPPPPVNGGGGVPCPATGSWPPGCIPGGNADVPPPSTDDPPTPIRYQEVSFTLYNNSSSTICGFYLILDGQPNWGANLLLADVYSGDRRMLSAKPDTYDIVISECNGTFARFYDHSIYKDLTLMYEN